MLILAPFVSVRQFASTSSGVDAVLHMRQNNKGFVVLIIRALSISSWNLAACSHG